MLGVRLRVVSLDLHRQLGIRPLLGRVFGIRLAIGSPPARVLDASRAGEHGETPW
jgi:hypothetical protein